MNFRGNWLIVTGASSGLGREMARVLAREHGANLVLVARREERLRELAEELTEQHGVEIQVLPADLGDEGDVQRVFEESTAANPIYGVILNAGITHFGHFDELSFERFKTMLSVNVAGVVQLTQSFLPYLEARAENGGIMLVSSLGGTTPVPYQSAYAGTKAFLVNYGCSLHHEMFGRGVSITTFAPGGIDTEMTGGKRFDDLRGWLMPVDQCAREAVTGFRKRRYLHVPGFMYRWGSVFMRLLPQRFLVSRVAAQYRNSLGERSLPSEGSP